MRSAKQKKNILEVYIENLHKKIFKEQIHFKLNGSDRLPRHFENSKKKIFIEGYDDVFFVEKNKLLI